LKTSSKERRVENKYFTGSQVQRVIGIQGNRSNEQRVRAKEKQLRRPAYLLPVQILQRGKIHNLQNGAYCGVRAARLQQNICICNPFDRIQ
jgi:hypothetical protein